MMKGDQLWFFDRFMKEDKISTTWGPMDRRQDGQPESGGTCVISRQPAFSVPCDDPGNRETMKWLVDEKILMVRIPTGKGW